MALPSTLTSPLSTKAVNDPEVAAQANVDLNVQNITGTGATITLDPTAGSMVTALDSSTAGTTIALTTTPSGTLQKGQRVTLVHKTSAATPTAYVAGTGVVLGNTAVTPPSAKRQVLEFRYDGTNLLLVAAVALSS